MGLLGLQVQVELVDLPVYLVRAELRGHRGLEEQAVAPVHPDHLALVELQELMGLLGHQV